MTPVVFTDLDGSLLDPDSYRWDATIPALEHIDRHAVPWVLVTGKTRAEVEGWRQRLGNNHPFVVENGDAVFIPHIWLSPLDDLVTVSPRRTRNRDRKISLWT